MDNRKIGAAECILLTGILSLAIMFSVAHFNYMTETNNLRHIEKSLNMADNYLVIVTKERQTIFGWAQKDGLNTRVARQFLEKIIDPPLRDLETVVGIRKRFLHKGFFEKIQDDYLEERIIFEEYKNGFFRKYPPYFNYQLCFQMRLRKILKKSRNCGLIKESKKFGSPVPLTPFGENPSPNFETPPPQKPPKEEILI